jgi:NADP-dependent 3-hydroxy acid dehydrogenase YdfG
VIDGSTAAIVTDGLSESGVETARTLAEQGCRMVISARRKSDLEAVADRIQQDGGTVHVVPMNVTQPDDVRAWSMGRSTCSARSMSWSTTPQ